MAFDLIAAGGYGSGELGDVTDPVGTINTTAYIDTSAGNITSPTLKDKQIGIYGDFAEDQEILIQVVGASENYPNCTEFFGFWCVTSISSIEDGYITLNEVKNTETWQKIVNASMSSEEDEGRKEFEELTITVTSIPHFRNLTLNEGCYLTPRVGFPLALKCSGTLTLNGGHIDLRNKGDARNRPSMYQESYGTLDVDKYSGWENSQTKDRFTMNIGDGAAFIIANKLVVANNASRIGNPNFKGIQFCRGASDSRNLPANATNIGGSTILLVARTITDFSPNIIAKYRSTAETKGEGLARCYIASNTALRNDEGLYAYDCISDNSRLTNNYPNIKSFGDGSSGESTLTTQLNNYAKVTAIDATQQVLTVTDKTTTGAEPFALGRLVMVHYTHKTEWHCGQSGRFFLAKILGINGDDITLDHAVPNSMFDVFNNYHCQLITIPQFTNYTLSGTHSATPKFDGSKGGIFAIAVSDTCNLSGGKINVEGKGGGDNGYGRTGLGFIGNAQNATKLPIGQGHGSVFILAKKLVMNSSTRIGATYSGAKQGGFAHDRTNTQSGYTGTPANLPVVTSGWGGGPGEFTLNNITQYGGYGSNALLNGDDSSVRRGEQGAHIMIIADTITGFNQAAISTGGDGSNHIIGDSYAKGGAGYGGAGNGGGGGGYNGGGAFAVVAIGDRFTNKGGGSSGWAFVYCNHAVDQNIQDTVCI